MYLLVNGFPKSGTHAVQKACEMLLGSTIPVSHLPYCVLPEGAQCVFIKRDPRDLILSMLAFRGIPITPENFQAAALVMPGPFDREDSIANHLAPYEGWLTDPRTLVLSYQDLIREDREMRRLAAWLGVEYPEGSWERLEGFTITYHFPHSDYTQIWNADLAAFWTRIGGDELLARWGY